MLFIHKLRSSSPRLPFCHLHDGGNAVTDSSGRDKDGRHREARSPCAWLCSTAREIRDKWRSLVAHIGSRRRRRGQVAVAVATALEFEYDPTSYALNFEDDQSREWDGEFPMRNFSVRLPASPDRSPPGKMPMEEVAVARS